MYGKTVGELSVYIKDDGGSRRKLWSKKGDQGNKWISGAATISNVSITDYQVEFEAIRGPSYHADIALDDIYFRETPCGVERLGCFNDRYKRALPDLIVNLRDKIDWYDMQKTVRECACTAHEQGYKLHRRCDARCETEVSSGSPQDGELGATPLEPPTQ
ncbi:MAM and LDL-receptor class A domain-containing 2-like, partial [Paramuricea clavata]